MTLVRMMMAVALATTGAATSTVGASATAAPTSTQAVEAEPAVANTVVVGVAGEWLDSGASEASTRAGALATLVDAHEVRDLGQGFFAFDVPGAVSQVLTTLRDQPEVISAEPNRTIRGAGGVAPNDPLFPDLWGLDNTGQTVSDVAGVPDADIDAPEAWAITTGDPSVVVAVVDSGIDATHPDLAPNLWTNPGGIAGCPAGTHGYDAVVDSCTTTGPLNEHGTHVAGTIAAVGGNAIGVVGVAPDVRLMDVRALGPDNVGTTEDLARALSFTVDAVEDGVDIRVLNASWGAPGSIPSIEALLTRLADLGVTIVAGAGNDGADLDQPSADFIPCELSVPGLVCVGSIDNDDTMSFFSNRGETAVDLAAPGRRIMSTVPGDGYKLLSGTSMASPHVAGIAALLESACPRSTPMWTKQLLLDTVEQTPALATTTVTGGRANAINALAADVGCPPAVAIGDGSLTIGRSARLTATMPVALSGVDLDTVSLTIDAPVGITAALGAADPTLATTRVAIEIHTAADLPPGVYPLDVTVEASGLSATATLTVTVRDLPITARSTELLAWIERGTEHSITVTWDNPGGVVADPTVGIEPAIPGVSLIIDPVQLGGTTETTVTGRLLVAADAGLGGLSLRSQPGGVLDTFAVAGPAPATFGGNGIDTTIDTPTSVGGSSVYRSTIDIPEESAPPAGVPYIAEVNGIDVTARTGGFASAVVVMYGPEQTGDVRINSSLLGLYNGVSGLDNRFSDMFDTRSTGTGSGDFGPDPSLPLSAWGSPTTAGEWGLAAFRQVTPPGFSIGGWRLVFPITAIGMGAPIPSVSSTKGSLSLTLQPAFTEQGATVTVERTSVAGGAPQVVATGLPLGQTVALTNEPQGTWTYASRSVTWDGRTARSPESVAIKVDRTAPGAPSISVAGPTPTLIDGIPWYPSPLSVRRASDGDPTLPDGTAGVGIDPATLTDVAISTEGITTLDITVADLLGNTSPAERFTAGVDTEPPSVKIAACPTSSVTRNKTVKIRVVANDGVGSGLQVDPSATIRLDTSKVGTFTFTATAIDRLGRPTSTTCRYVVTRG